MTSGVAVMARILASLAADEPQTAGDLARREPIPRSSVFAVLKRLETAGLVARTAQGVLEPGEAAGRFAYSAHGLGPLYGPAEIILEWLRAETGGSASLQAADGTVLHRRVAENAKASDSLSAPIRDAEGQEIAHVTLDLRPSGAESEAVRCRALTVAAAESLQAHLREPAAPPAREGRGRGRGLP
jgi:DNA-binding IclR family transcriptional regulator